MLNTRYFRFGREFRLSVHPSGSNIYNTENKLYILKLNGFERFPGKLFTSTIVKRDFMPDEILPKQPVSAGVVH